MKVTAHNNRPYSYRSRRDSDLFAPPVRALGTAAGATLGLLAGQQGQAVGAFFGGATGMVGGFAAGYLAGTTIADEFGGNATARYLSGLVVGASTAALTTPGAALLAAAGASPATAVVLGLVGGVGGFLVAQQVREHV